MVISQDTDIKLSDHMISYIKMVLGIQSDFFATPNAQLNDMDFTSCATTFEVTLNNTGYATIIYSPGFLISKELMQSFKKNGNYFPSNVVIANGEKAQNEDFQSGTFVPSPCLVENKVDTYKFALAEIRIGDPAIDPIPGDASTDEPAQGQCKISCIDGKGLHAIVSYHSIFNNHLYNNSINSNGQVYDSRMFNLTNSIFYKYTNLDIQDVKFNKNGRSSSGEHPLVIDDIQIPRDVTPCLIAYSHYLTGADNLYHNNFSQASLKPQLHLIAQVKKNLNAQDAVLDEHNQYNDKLIKIQLHDLPYKKIRISICSYYIIKRTKPKVDNSGPFVLQPLLNSSTVDQQVAQLAVNMIQVDPTADFRYIKKTIDEESRNSAPSWLKTVWEVTKTAAPAVMDIVDKFVPGGIISKITGLFS
jgi:hypothetical protein